MSTRAMTSKVRSAFEFYMTTQEGKRPADSFKAFDEWLDEITASRKPTSEGF